MYVDPLAVAVQFLKAGIPFKETALSMENPRIEEVLTGGGYGCCFLITISRLLPKGALKEYFTKVS